MPSSVIKNKSRKTKGGSFTASLHIPDTLAGVLLRHNILQAWQDASLRHGALTDTWQVYLLASLCSYMSSTIPYFYNDYYDLLQAGSPYNVLNVLLQPYIDTYYPYYYISDNLLHSWIRSSYWLSHDQSYLNNYYRYYMYWSSGGGGGVRTRGTRHRGGADASPLSLTSADTSELEEILKEVSIASVRRLFDFYTHQASVCDGTPTCVDIYTLKSNPNLGVSLHLQRDLLTALDSICKRITVPEDKAQCQDILAKLSKNPSMIHSVLLDPSSFSSVRALFDILPLFTSHTNKVQGGDKALQKAVDECKEDLAKCNKRESDAQKNLDVCKREVQQLKQIVDNTVKTHSKEMDNNREERKEEKAKAEKNLEEVRKEKIDVEEKLKALQAELDASKTAQADAERARDEARARVTTHESTIAEKNAKILTVEAEKAQELDALRQQISNITTEKDARIRAVEEERDISRRDKESTITQIQADANARISQEQEITQRRINAIEKERTTLIEENKVVHTNINKFIKMAEDTENVIDQKDKEIETMTIKLTELEHEITKKEQDIGDARNRVRIAEENASETKQNMDTIKTMAKLEGVESAKNDLDKLKNELEQCKGDYNATLESLNKISGVKSIPEQQYDEAFRRIQARKSVEPSTSGNTGGARQRHGGITKKKSSLLKADMAEIRKIEAFVRRNRKDKKALKNLVSILPKKVKAWFLSQPKSNLVRNLLVAPKVSRV